MADQDVEDLLLEMAYKRLDESNQEKSSIVSNASIILGIDSILIGLMADIWNDNNSLWLFLSVVVLMDSLFLCLLILIAQKFKVIDVKKTWNGLSQTDINTIQEVKQQIILGIDDMEKNNTNKLQRLWQYYNGAIGALLASLIMILFSFL